MSLGVSVRGGELPEPGAIDTKSGLEPDHLQRPFEREDPWGDAADRVRGDDLRVELHGGGVLGVLREGEAGSHELLSSCAYLGCMGVRATRGQWPKPSFDVSAFLAIYQQGWP